MMISMDWSIPGRLRRKVCYRADSITGPQCSGYIRIDTQGMADGDVAGLAAFDSDSGVLAIHKNGDGIELVMSRQVSVFAEPAHDIARVDETVYAAVPLRQPEVYLRVDADFTPGRDMVSFSYSLDGTRWTPIGEPVKMVFDYLRLFIGAKFAIFNYATKSAGSYVDIDEFVYSPYIP